MNRPQQPKPHVLRCNSCQSVNCAPHCPAPKHCAWITCTDCKRVSDNFGHHIDRRAV